MFMLGGGAFAVSDPSLRITGIGPDKVVNTFDPIGPPLNTVADKAFVGTG